MTPPPAPEREFPLWLVIIVVTGLWMFFRVATSDIYADVLARLMKGLGITVVVTLVSYSAACVLGLALAIAQLSRVYLLRQIARLYVEVMRGVPIIVLLLYVAFVLAPGMVTAWNWLASWFDLPPVRGRDFPLLWRAVIALTLAYASFLAEVFRAGLVAVPRGQIEAATALGLSRWQRFRHVVFPQAFRLILPPLGNDFVAMVKDSSLVSVLGVTDITQLGKVISAGNFRYFETYNVVSLLYLALTISLSLALRALEQRLRRRRA